GPSPFMPRLVGRFRIAAEYSGGRPLKGPLAPFELISSRDSDQPGHGDEFGLFLARVQGRTPAQATMRSEKPATSWVMMRRSRARPRRSSTQSESIAST